MRSCSEVTRAIASDEYLTKGLLYRLGTRMHLAMCRHCAQYARQLRALAQLCREMGSEVSTSEIQAAQERIVERLSQ